MALSRASGKATGIPGKIGPFLANFLKKKKSVTDWETGMQRQAGQFAPYYDNLRHFLHDLAAAPVHGHRAH